jgi:uncharacterized membrane protein
MNVESPTKEIQNKSLTQIIYGLHAASILVGVTYIVAVIVNYVKRDEVAGTWLESHFTWQIRTFWYSLLYYVIGIATAWFLVGIPILIAAFVWFVYRIVKGWLRLNEGKPMYT